MIFATKLNSRNVKKCNGFGVPHYNKVRLCLQSSISRANCDRRSQIEKQLVIYDFSAGRREYILHE